MTSSSANKWLPALLIFAVGLPAAEAADCNQNGADDSLDIQVTDFSITSARTADTFSGKQALAFPDVNLDGKRDVVFTQIDENVFKARLFLKSGNFFSEYGFLPNLFIPTGIGVGDFDGNAFPDIGLTDGASHSVAFNLGDTTYSLAPVPSLPPLELESLADAVTEQVEVDLNGDGRLDQIRRSGERSAEVLLRLPSNELTPTHSIEFSPRDNSVCEEENGTHLYEIGIPDVRDLDGDGDLDPLVKFTFLCQFLSSQNEGTELVILVNQGDDTFDEKIPVLSNEGFDGFRRCSFTSYRDLNNDGIEDFAMTCTALGSGRSNSSSGVFFYTIELQAASKDRNENQIPDECERAVSGDFDGDRVTDNTVVRATGELLTWLTRPSAGSEFFPLQEVFGLSQFDTPFAGDFDGNGKFEPGVVRNAGAVIPELFGLHWYSLNVDNSVTAVQWGLSGDLPVTGQFDQDNSTDRAVVRNINGQLTWFVRLSSSADPLVIPWGLPGDLVLSGDFTGDGIDEIVVAREFLGGVYWFIRSVDGNHVATILWGLSGDAPLSPEDVDGDGMTDLAIVRPNGRFLTFFIRLSSGTERIENFGLLGDVPYLGKFSGAGAEPSLFRTTSGESLHYQRTTSGLNRTQKWGLPGDIFVLPSGRGVSSQ